MSKIAKAYDKVVELLMLKEEYRDSDEALVVRYWWEESKLLVNFDTMTAKDFFLLYKSQKITPADTITRLRRKAQQMNVNLRGATYKNRHEKESEIVSELNSL